MSEKTSPDNLLIIDNMFKDLETLMVSLYSRWMDEKEYEDINEYMERIKRDLSPKIHILKMNKRPFGFNFSLGDSKEYVVEISKNTYRWKRIR